MNQQERDQNAIDCLKACYKAHGEHPNYRARHQLNNNIATFIGDILTDAQITEAMAVCHDLHTRQTTKPDLFHNGHEVEPLDDVYTDALADYQHDDEQKLYQIIQEATK